MLAKKFKEALKSVKFKSLTRKVPGVTNDLYIIILGFKLSSALVIREECFSPLPVGRLLVLAKALDDACFLACKNAPRSWSSPLNCDAIVCSIVCSFREVARSYDLSSFAASSRYDSVELFIVLSFSDTF